MSFHYFQTYHYFSTQPKVIDSFLGFSDTFWGVLASVILGIIALFGDRIRRHIFKPNIQPIQAEKTSQQIGGETYVYQRFIVKNARRKWFRFLLPNEATCVHVFLTYERVENLPNFIPLPLAWTHFETKTRDTPPGEEVYVDLFRKKIGEEKYQFCWAPQTGSEDETLKYFDSDGKRGRIRLEFFDSTQKIGDFYLKYKNEEDIVVV